MQVNNTSALPLALFHLHTDSTIEGHVIEPGASLDIDLQAGEGVSLRISTETIEAPAPAPEPPPAAATDIGREGLAAAAPADSATPTTGQ